ncbi:MAG: restriction endonuclease, partial [Prevotellaceae bacterium]|nr:restriction endonuclease [Prevotellaceae bacterium]
EKLDETKSSTNKNRKKNWWKYGSDAKSLYETISKVDQVMVVAQVSKTLAFAFVPPNQVISMMCIVLAFDDYASFCILQSTIHKKWVQKYASALKADTRYTPSDVFETFPFPDNIKNELYISGERFYIHRQSIMRKFNLGLTKLYNQFHNAELCIITDDEALLDDASYEKCKGKISLSFRKHLTNNNLIKYHVNDLYVDIQEMRRLQIVLDKIVLDAYGWSDIPLRHDFYEVDYLPENDRIRFTIHPNARREILKRLLQLNHQIYEEEKSTISKSTNMNKKSNLGTLFELC